MGINKEELFIRKMILNLLNNQNGDMKLSKDLFDISADMEDYLKGQIVKLLSSDDAKETKLNQESRVPNLLFSMDESKEVEFIETSRLIAEGLFDIMCDSFLIPAACFVMLSFSYQEEVYYGLLKLPLEEVLKADFRGSGDCIDVGMSKSTALNRRGKLQEAIIIHPVKGSARLYEKRFEMQNGEKIFYLSERFLESIAQMPIKRKISILAKSINEACVHHEMNVQDQIQCKKITLELMENDGFFDIPKISQELFGNTPQAKEYFDKQMERYDLSYDKFMPKDETSLKPFLFYTVTTDLGVEIKVPSNLVSEYIEFREYDGSITLRGIDRINLK